MPAAPGIAVDIAPVKRTNASQVRDRQLGRTGGTGYSFAVFADKALEKGFHGDTLLSRLIGEAGFGLARNIYTHGCAPVVNLTALNSSTPELPSVPPAAAP